MTSGFEDFTINFLRALASFDETRALENNREMIPSVYLSWDAEQATLEGDLAPAAAGGLTLNARVDGKPRWVTLNLALGTETLNAGDVVGLVLEAQANVPLQIPVFLRAATKGGEGDIGWSEPVECQTEPGLTLAFAEIPAWSPFGGSEAYYTLVLPLLAPDLTLTISGLRVFVVRAERGLRLAAPTLANAT